MRGDPLHVRARHWTRWRRGRALEAWRHRAHIDVLGDDARAAWLCSWQRSGSTWLAEVLASAPGTRLIYEPANLPGALFSGEAAANAALPIGAGPELDAIERALLGRVHGPWVDQLCTGHVMRRRVVKDVRAVGLLGQVSARHPSTPVVLLVRHPLSVALSAVALGWTPRADVPHADQVLDEVRRWTAMHALAMRDGAAARALVVAYEHLAASPEAALARIRTHLEAHHATWRGLDVDVARLTAPSATSFRRGSPLRPEDWIGSFDDVDPGLVHSAGELLADAGLGTLYATSPEPLADPDGVASLFAR